MPTPADRCSFEVVYKKNAENIDAIDHVVVRTGLSDASVTLTIPQITNLARLLDIMPKAPDRGGLGDRLPEVHNAVAPRVPALRSE